MLVQCEGREEPSAAPEVGVAWQTSLKEVTPKLASEK